MQAARTERRGRGRTRTRAERGRPALPREAAAAAEVQADPEGVARTILLDALTGQARTRKELADKLAKREVPDDVATELLDRFTEVGLIDDAAFARQWVESRHRSRGLAPRALAQELRRKGVGDEEAKAALEQIDEDDQRGRCPGAGGQEAALHARPRPARSRPGGWPGCSPARATPPAWPSRWCARRWPSERRRTLDRRRPRRTCPRTEPPPSDRGRSASWWDGTRVSNEREVLTYELFGTATRELAQEVGATRASSPT